MKLHRISGEKVLKAFKRMDYEEIMIRGSHRYLLSSTGSLFTIPVHSGKSIVPKTFQSILQAAGITQEEFEHYL